MEFKATTENFPSSYKTEILAVLTALLIIPKNCIVTFYVDNKAVTEYLNHHPDSPSPCNFFKEDSNIYWNTIKDIISTNNLTVKFIKIPAYSGIYWNEYIDKLAKSAHGSNQPLFQLRHTSLPDIKYFPHWNNILVEKNLRKFITNMSWNTGFEKWLTLNRNKKYRNLQVDWISTFTILMTTNPRNILI